ncbi:MAG: hypothetical protein ACRCS9_10430 [Hyphomicrobium sp.]
MLRLISLRYVCIAILCPLASVSAFDVKGLLHETANSIAPFSSNTPRKLSRVERQLQIMASVPKERTSRDLRPNVKVYAFTRPQGKAIELAAALDASEVTQLEPVARDIAPSTRSVAAPVKTRKAVKNAKVRTAGNRSASAKRKPVRLAHAQPRAQKKSKPKAIWVIPTIATAELVRTNTILELKPSDLIQVAFSTSMR